MKGVVFTEFLEMVEERFSPEVADRIIEESSLPSGGAYTSIGTYDHGELLQLVTQLSAATGIPVPGLVKAFGTYLFARFSVLYPTFFEGVSGTFAFLHNLEGYIHMEVRKFYPDAELPTFHVETPEPERLVMTYQSTRPFANLAEGLIEGCIQHYGGGIDLAVEDLSAGQGTRARFTLTKRA